MTDISEIIKKINQKIEIPKINNKIHNGLVWINVKNNKGFLCIPKCASSGIRSHFKYLLTKDINKINKKNIEIFTILRDPIKRYISGYIEVIQDCKQYPGGRYHHNLEISKNKINIIDKIIKSNLTNIEKFIEFTNLILNKWGFFEPHTTPQINFLSKNNILFKNIKIFKLEKLNELEKYFDSKIPKLNSCENEKLKNELLNFIECNSEFKNKIINLYKNDFIIYNNI